MARIVQCRSWGKWLCINTEKELPPSEILKTRFPLTNRIRVTDRNKMFTLRITFFIKDQTKKGVKIIHSDTLNATF